MNITRDIYASSLTLLTDFYQLTMAYGYWKQGIAEKKSVFHLFFRENPFNGGFTINCGLAYVIDYINTFRFDDEAMAFLAESTGEGDEPLFEPAFLDYLRTLEFSCDVDAIPEGTAVFPHEPLL
ncbi:MAG: nicotinate phosphoribosyltransferase, partial [Tunicatimonas sp.]